MKNPVCPRSDCISPTRDRSLLPILTLFSGTHTQPGLWLSRHTFALLFPFSLLVGFGRAKQQQLCIHAPLRTLRSEWSPWRLSPRWTSRQGGCLSPGQAPPAGKPLARCLGLAAPCRLAQRGGLHSVFADRGLSLCPAEAGRARGRSNGPRHCCEIARLMCARCCLHLCAKSSKHTVSGWQGCVGCSRLRLKFKPSVEYSGRCSCPLFFLSCICPTLMLQTVLCWTKSVHCPTKLKCSQATSSQIRICNLQSLHSEANLILI